MSKKKYPYSYKDIKGKDRFVFYRHRRICLRKGNTKARNGKISF